jgi:flagellar assembly protein FliH
LSRIIKAAELKVLIPNDEQTVIRSAEPIERDGVAPAQGTILESSNLLQGAQEKAAAIIAEAEKKAQAILSAAEIEGEELRLQAQQEGFAQGREAGFQAGKEEALTQGASFLDILERTVEESARVRAESLAALEDDFLKLSLLLADKIVRKVVEEDISWLEPIIREALTALGQVDDILVRLHPNDYAVISGNPDLMTIATRTRIRFDSDVTIAQGGCLIESENGLIDARLEKRLGKIGKQLLEVLYDENA